MLIENFVSLWEKGLAPPPPYILNKCGFYRLRRPKDITKKCEKWGAQAFLFFFQEFQAISLGYNNQQRGGSL
jgi:hypothetical protein